MKAIAIQCAVSLARIGAVLLEKGRPVEHDSHAMTRRETNRWRRVDRELELFTRTSIDARQVTVETDHKPLITVAKKPLSSAP